MMNPFFRQEGLKSERDLRQTERKAAFRCEMLQLHLLPSPQMRYGNQVRVRPEEKPEIEVFGVERQPFFHPPLIASTGVLPSRHPVLADQAESCRACSTLPTLNLVFRILTVRKRFAFQKIFRHPESDADRVPILRSVILWVLVV